MVYRLLSCSPCFFYDTFVFLTHSKSEQATYKKGTHRIDMLPFFPSVSRNFGFLSYSEVTQNFKLLIKLKF